MDTNEDLYDDIFDHNKENQYAEADIDDLYGNIHNPEVAETALDKVKGLSLENEKFRTQNSQLKNQITILNSINLELKTRNTGLEKNIKDLIETSRVEINRKNEQVRNLRAELDNVLFKRAARNINSRELEGLLKKYRHTEEPYSKLPTKPKPVKKVEAVVGSPDLNSGNRQFVSKKRKKISLEFDAPVTKKAKVENNKENVVNPRSLVPAVANKVLDANSNQNKREIKADAKPILGSTKSTVPPAIIKPVLSSKPGTVSKSTVKPGHPISEPKTDISLISKYVKDRPRKSKTQVPDSRKELKSDPNPDSVPNNAKTKVEAPQAQDKPVSKSLEPTNKPAVSKSGKTAPIPTDTSKNASQVKVVPEVSTTTVVKPKRVYISFDKPESSDSKTPVKLKESVIKPPTQQDSSKGVKSDVTVKSQSAEASQDSDIAQTKKSKDKELPVKLFNITAVSNEPKTPVSKVAKFPVSQEPKTPVSIKDPVSQVPNNPRQSKYSDLKEGRTAISKEPETSACKSTPTSSRVQEATPVTSSQVKKSHHDLENNCSVAADDEASTSSQLKSPICRPKTTKAPQEWALGHQLFDIFDGKKTKKSKSGTGKKSEDKAVEKLKKECPVVVKDEVKKVQKEEEEDAGKHLNVKDLECPEKAVYGSTRWNCEHHSLGFRTRDELRAHRSKGSCFMKKSSPESKKSAMDIDSSKHSREDTKGRNMTPSGDKQKTRIPSGDQKDFYVKDMKSLVQKKDSRNKEKVLTEVKRKSMKKKIQSEAGNGVEVSGESLILSVPLEEVVVSKCEGNHIEKHSSVTSVELSAAIRSITPTDDLLELAIEPCDAFEDELDFEPEETTTEASNGNVYFKNLNTNFSIPKVDKADISDPNEGAIIKSTPSKTKAAEREIEKKNEKLRSSGRERSRSRNRVERISAKTGRRSRSRRRKSRSLSRRRTSKSRNRSRSKNRRKSGKSPRKSSVSRKRSPSRERGRNSRRRRSRSRNRGREPRSLSRKRSGERRRPSPRLEKLSRKSQSLSPQRLRSMSPEIDIDQIEIEDGLSLDSLEKIKQQLMGKMCLNDDLEPVNKHIGEDVEEGEITDTEDEEVQDILKKKSKADLRQKLLRKSRPSSKTGSDKENEAKLTKKPSKDSRLQENIGIKVCLKEYSAEDIENKLIPFKKRQFHELQFEELKIRKQIERARSKSNTPVRSMSESSASDCPQNNSASSCVSSYAPDNPMVDLKMSPMVDIRVSPIKMKSPAVSRRVSRSTSRSDDNLSPGSSSRSRKGARCEQKNVNRINATVSPTDIDRKVSPIKLSLRGVVIERPSSSSSEANVETVEVILEKVENSSQEEKKLQVQVDDNAVFPSSDCPMTPTKFSRPSTDIAEVAKDLCLTDDSDFDDSPVKIFNHPTSHISPFRRPEGPLDLSSPKRPPLTPKNPPKPAESDISSPQGISNLLRSPFVSHSLLSSPVLVTTSKLSSNMSFSQAVTSTPSPSLPSSAISLKVPPPPFFLQSPVSSSNNLDTVQPQLKKKRKSRLGRSATSTTSRS
eukprot:GFUD01039319.1.p1 GENE.GFUD01039319.1~~GFUD01039319.1.p1  ORF type:complete len:1529 (-),score=453.06 GFUD01039319.1:105-4691(-)